MVLTKCSDCCHADLFGTNVPHDSGGFVARGLVVELGLVVGIWVSGGRNMHTCDAGPHT